MLINIKASRLFCILRDFMEQLQQGFSDSTLKAGSDKLQKKKIGEKFT